MVKVYYVLAVRPPIGFVRVKVFVEKLHVVHLPTPYLTLELIVCWMMQ
jgi:hypothetical protein